MLRYLNMNRSYNGLMMLLMKSAQRFVDMKWLGFLWEKHSKSMVNVSD